MLRDRSETGVFGFDRLNPSARNGATNEVQCQELTAVDFEDRAVS
jgi:hypothetical protein